jgi:hypothetical protein
VVFSTENNVIDETGQIVGQILTYHLDRNIYKILIVLQTSAIDSLELKLNNPEQNKINLIPFATA